MIPSDFNNHVPNEIGRALHEQCIKSMKDFYSLNKEIAKRELRLCNGCHQRYFREEMTTIQKVRPDGSRLYHWYCVPCSLRYRPRWMRGQGDEYRK